MMIYFRTSRAGLSHVDPCLPVMQACRDHDCVVELENGQWHVARIQSYVSCIGDRRRALWLCLAQ